MRNRIIAALIAAGLLVGAGFVTSVVSAPGTAGAQEDSSGDDEGRGHSRRGFEFLSGVLDELVDQGTISQEDADAVLNAVQEKAAGIKEEREALHEMIKGFLEDGVITEDEADQLPEDHWLRSDVFDEAWADDELTVEEIRAARPHPRRDTFKKGARFGALLDDGGIDQDEYDSLPDEHPLKQIDVSEYLEDDVITVEELREIRSQHRPDGLDEDTDA